MTRLRPFLTRCLRALLAAALVLALPGTSSADPVAAEQGDDASAELVAVSLTGDARCTSATCVAVTGTGTAKSGCAGSGCDTVECDDFFCVNVAASGLGTSEAYTFCQTFGATCIAVGVSARTYVFMCYTDVNNDTICRGAG